jgi:hypothetical protein
MRARTVLIIAIIAILGAIFALFKLNSSAQAFVDEAVPRILKDWSVDTLVGYSSIPSGKQVSYSLRDQMQDLLNTSRQRLGHFQRCEEAEGRVATMVTLRTGIRIFGAFSSRCTCEEGNAEVVTTVVLVNGRWRISEFRMRNPLPKVRS